MFHTGSALFAPKLEDLPDRQLSLGRRFLEDGLIAPWQLFYALTATSRWNCGLVDVLISKGWLSEEQALPHLSKHYFAQIVDLSKAPPDARLAHLLSPQFCIKHAIVPWISMNGQLAFATSRPQLFERLRKSLPSGPNGVRLVLVKSAQLQSYLALRSERTLTSQCEARVAEVESCRSWALQSHRRIAISVALALGTVLLFGLFPKNAWAGLAFAILGTQLLAATMKICAFWASQRKTPAVNPMEIEGKRHPKISVMVPLFKETEIAAALIRRLSALTYPRALLDIVLVLEAKDDQTKETLSHTKLPNWIRVIEVPEGQGLTTKPRALNYALDFCKGDIVGIWDAEDAPAPDQLEQVAAAFENAAPDVACLQGILDYYNPRTNWLSRCFTLEYSMWFRVIIRGMSRLGAAVPLGGTTLFLRREAIEAVGGWDAHNVTEDADLGIRLYRYGYRTELIPTVTQEEANCRFRPWVKQRSRWLKGYMVTYLVHMRSPQKLLKELGFVKFLGFNAIFLSTLSQFLLAPFVWSFWILAFGLSLSWIKALPAALVASVAVLFVLITLLDIFLAIYALRGQNRKWLAGWAFTMPIYFTLATLGAYKALYELVVRPFYWDKTAHGQTPEGIEAEFSALGA
ncbi:glycosyltransferase family 2 protein [Cognatishimia activa]|uniref:glycosyltransferase family 2 protein n=1 Tax=Cognatishimia activa TaxID=1715691 RepID=UPI0022305BCA|nr:glycosyltransferase family 2 protein [Cognatishimia activa]UZD91441.1 glycosyltransferase [Cognatishimia activa]